MAAIRPLSFLFLLALALGACGRGESPDPAGADAVRPLPVPQSEMLAGRPLAAVVEGPWTLRRGGGGGEKDGGEVRRRLGEALHAEAEGYGPDEAAAMPLADGRDAGAARPTADPADPGAEPTTPPGSVVPTPTPGGAMPPQGSPLRAGYTDDNEDFEAFLAFLATWTDQEGVADRHAALDVSDRRALRVVDGRGHPVPGAHVTVVDEAGDRVVATARTYGDGRAPFYPRLGGAAVPASGYTVEVRHGPVYQRVPWDGLGEEFVVRLPGVQPIPEPIGLDVCIVLDTTGSMGDEIARIKATLLDVMTRLEALGLEFDLRIGAVLYRDVSDAYVTMRHPFTKDIEAFSAALRPLDANGGGDEPESLNQGLAEAVGRMDWRAHAAKVAFLIADAPPHMDYEGDVPYDVSLRAAVDRGVRIHAVAASGLNAFGTLVFRQVAQFTRGRFIFIEYGSTAASAASHGVAGKVGSNNLDDILFDRIRAELAEWGRPDPAASGG